MLLFHLVHFLRVFLQYRRPRSQLRPSTTTRCSTTDFSHHHPSKLIPFSPNSHHVNSFSLSFHFNLTSQFCNPNQIKSKWKIQRRNRQWWYPNSTVSQTDLRLRVQTTCRGSKFGSSTFGLHRAWLTASSTTSRFATSALRSVYHLRSIICAFRPLNRLL